MTASEQIKNEHKQISNWNNENSAKNQTNQIESNPCIRRTQLILMLFKLNIMNKNLGKMEEINTRCGKFEKSNSNSSKTGYKIFETKEKQCWTSK